MKRGTMRVMFRQGYSDPSIFLPTKRTQRLIWIIDAIVKEGGQWFSLANVGSVHSGYRIVRSLVPTQWTVIERPRTENGRGFIIVSVPYEERDR